MREFYADMNDIEVDNIGRELIGQLNTEGWPIETNVAQLQHNSSIRTPIFLYVILSTTSGLTSLYHREILDCI